MRKVVVIVAVIIATLALSACETTNDIPEVVIHNRSVLGVLSYISSSFLEEVNDVNSNRDVEVIKLSIDKPDKDAVLEDTEVGPELDQINIYIDKLKIFIENGIEGFDSIVEEESDRVEYENMITILVQEEEYILYYNVQVDTTEISGIFVVDSIEYIIDVENSEYNTTEFDDKEKQSMMLRARNGDNVIIVEYEIKQDENEKKQTFTCTTSINGVVEQFEVEIKTEDSEYVLTITDEGNVYIFKMDDGDEEDFNYKLDYIVNGVKGKVRIKVQTDEFGNESYFYRIQEKNNKIDIEIEDPDNDGETSDVVDGL